MPVAHAGPWHFRSLRRSASPSSCSLVLSEMMINRGHWRLMRRCRCAGFPARAAMARSRCPVRLTRSCAGGSPRMQTAHRNGTARSSAIRNWPPWVWSASVRHTRGGTLTNMSARAPVGSPGEEQFTGQNPLVCCSNFRPITPDPNASARRRCSIPGCRVATERRART
jgi:hypothetical protein